jgi:hypothetical protein
MRWRPGYKNVYLVERFDEGSTSRSNRPPGPSAGIYSTIAACFRRRTPRQRCRERAPRVVSLRFPLGTGALLARAICRHTTGARKPHAGRGDGLAAADTAGQTALRLAQADPGTGVRYHQICDGIPPVPVARSRSRSRRMEPRHHELEHQEDVCAQPRLSAFGISPASRQRCWKPPRGDHITQSGATISADCGRIDSPADVSTKSDKLLEVVGLLSALRATEAGCIRPAGRYHMAARVGTTGPPPPFRVDTMPRREAL